MEFNDVYEIATYFEKRQLEIPYPSRPIKPSRENFASHSQYGIAMDEWENGTAEWREKRRMYNLATRIVNDDFKDALLDFLELIDHPRAQKFWELVWDRGHSGGYSEIATEALTLAELLK